MFSKYVQWRLERYVRKYFKKHHPTLIAVVGSVGKTTTKTAIGTVLSSQFRIQLEPENHNSPLSVPLAIMGVKYPPVELVHSVGTWRRVFKAMKKRVKAPQGVDVIIQELGTDHPGDLATYQKYLKPDITVVTSVSPEHMENFPGGYSGLTIVNHDDVDGSFAQYAKTSNLTDYGINGGEYRIEVTGGSPLQGYQVNLYAPGLHQPITTTLHLLGNHMLKAACAAFAVGMRLGMAPSAIAEQLTQLRPVAGRMNPLPGRKGSVLIDDTYNSSPVAAIAALQTLLLDWVITIGDMAGQYLAPMARKMGCQVRTFNDPLSAGTFAGQMLKENAVVLIKGSQNKVFAEEATKVLLRDTNDKDKLVRQDDYWLKRKQDWYAELHNQTGDELDNE